MGAKPSIKIDYKVVEASAYLGNSLDEIALIVGISPSQLDVRKKSDPELNKAWKAGKARRKNELVKNIHKLSTQSKSDEVRFKSSKYELNVFHGVSEKNTTEHTGEIVIRKRLFDK